LSGGAMLHSDESTDACGHRSVSGIDENRRDSQ